MHFIEGFLPELRPRLHIYRNKNANDLTIQVQDIMDRANAECDIVRAQKPATSSRGTGRQPRHTI